MFGRKGTDRAEDGWQDGAGKLFCAPLGAVDLALAKEHVTMLG